MIRAGVFIGVQKTGNLPALNDAVSGATAMYEWARSQGMQAKLISDAHTDVHPDLISTAIQEITDGAGVDQLVLYFAGHGAYINRGEQWLMTAAPRNSNAVVNVNGSVELARYCGIKHVVLISDTCRVAPEGNQAQNIRGSEVFPNEVVSDAANAVDQFFACRLGKAAMEVRNLSAGVSSFRALYTTVLLEALRGEHDTVLESGEDGDSYDYVRPVPLEVFLEREVPVRLQRMNLQQRIDQNPDAIITAHRHWLARLMRIAGKYRAPKPATRSRDLIRPQLAEREFRKIIVSLGGDPARRSKPASELPAAVLDTLIGTAVEGKRSDLNLYMSMMRGTPSAERVVADVQRFAAPFGPDHLETGCGVKVRGARIAEAVMAAGEAFVFGEDRSFVRVRPQRGAGSLLLRFDDCSAVVIAAIPGFLTALTFENGELIDAAYEPSANTPLGADYATAAEDIRLLRGIIASASQFVRFRLDRIADPLSIAQRMQYSKGIDPTLAVYAAYAYHDLQRIDRIRNISAHLNEMLGGVTVFDVALLGRQLVNAPMDRASCIVPFVPLFSQAWSLLAANRVKLRPELKGVASHLRESIWSVFNPEAVEPLRLALMSGDVR